MEAWVYEKFFLQIRLSLSLYNYLYYYVKFE